MLKITEKEKVKEELQRLLKRRSVSFDPEKEARVKEMIGAVAANGDAALRELTLKYDKVKIESFRVNAEEVQAAYREVEADFLSALKTTIANLTAFHQKQRTEEWFETLPNDALLGLRVIPIEKVGIYVPGGRAAYPSTVLMNAIPAKVAGVKKIVMVSPPPIHPAILVAAAEVGIGEIYQVGGAQAIAALAFGSESIPKVDKIVGPGNVYVALAKKFLFGVVGIESLAGPSDVMILADADAEAEFIAADMLSQAEHDPESSAVLVTDSRKLAEEVVKQIEKQKGKLSRKEIIETSLGEGGAILLVRDLKEGVEIVNEFAPEHLEILASNPQRILEKVTNAGAVFMGPYSPVAVGDYAAGPNHVLPTFGAARFSSPLGVYDFIKYQSIVGYTKPALQKIREAAEVMAKVEGLDAHARSIEIRFEQ
ncbi:histidinol dehydrogenase [Candidatus Saganbacteria bacterium]|nr:histidinol dehydrogenase [Candidatus Saganbacteria bacterium]